MTTQQTIDQSKLLDFAGKGIGDAGAPRSVEDRATLQDHQDANSADANQHRVKELSMSIESKTDTLVDAAWVAAHLQDPDVRLVEVDVNRSAHDARHAEGAILWDVYTDLLQPSYHIIEAPALEQLLSRSGITRESIIVFHGYAGALGFWLLRLYRHPEVRLLDGSRERWEAD